MTYSSLLGFEENIKITNVLFYGHYITVERKQQINLKECGFTYSGSQTYHPTYSDSSTNVNLKTMRRQLFVLDVEKKPKAYTGLTLDVLKLVFSHVELKASRMKYWYGSSRVDDSFDDTENDVSGQKRGALRELKLWEEYLMSLVRLRKGLDTDVLAFSCV
ncbi:unnamed protein product [Mytilus coruscus]|uniref:Uncharacterized protein n=1 Tax=Mytilus coruscus TaxID=42192 RepID=A0A6J8E8A7_MYTCO|nr:unnamed protein product [Mytilus coruscus]